MTYTQTIAKCRDIFSEEFAQYGDAFVAYTKEQLLQKIEAKIEAAHSLLQGDTACRDSFTSIYNYSVIAYMLETPNINYSVIAYMSETPNIETGSWIEDYTCCQDMLEAVYLAKDKEYHSKWKTMSISHLLSEIAVKIRRNKSSGIDISAFRDNLIDIANYAAFCEIHFEDSTQAKEQQIDTANSMTNWNEIAAEHHAAMVEKGFHENYSHTRLLLWGIGEVGEADAAWRKNRRADMAGFNASKNVSNIYEISLNYEVGIKGTIEEELADIVLIMLDYAAANNININPTGFVQKGSSIKVLMCIAKFICFIDNVCEMLEDGDENPLFGWTIITSYVNSIFANLETLAKDLDINLEEQVRLKMQYNKTRPYKHGDKN